LPPLLPHDCDTGVTKPWQKLMPARPGAIAALAGRRHRAVNPSAKEPNLAFYDAEGRSPAIPAHLACNHGHGALAVIGLKHSQLTQNHRFTPLRLF
jgi:hypothetical protein